MTAEREHAAIMQSIAEHGGSIYAAALEDRHLFTYYFEAHARSLGDDVYPFGYGALGAFVVAVSAMDGWWHDPETSTTYQSSKADSNKVVVFGLDIDRINLIKEQATADGAEVVACIRLDTNEVCG
jgi:hypothetical protein